MSWGTITSHLNGLALDVAGGSTAKGASVIMWPKHGGVNQSWQLTKEGFLISANTGYCLDISGGNRKEGAKLCLWPKHGGSNQKWKYDDGYLVSELNGLAIDIAGANRANGATLCMWKKHGGDNQKWNLSDGVIQGKKKMKSKVGKGVKFFLSHKQDESAGLAMELWYKCGMNKGAWLDVKNEDGQNKAEMVKGVKGCSHFVIILTPKYFDSEYCRLEIQTAIQYKRKAILVFNTDKLSKSQIGSMLEKAGKYGLKIKDWPSAFPISTDLSSMEAQFAHMMKAAAIAKPMVLAG